MSLIEISKSIPQNLDYSERNPILPKNDTQKSGNSQKLIPKNPGIAQKGTQKSGSNPKKVPKIMAHARITTYASYPPRPELNLENEYPNKTGHNLKTNQFCKKDHNLRNQTIHKN